MAKQYSSIDKELEVLARLQIDLEINNCRSFLLDMSKRVDREEWPCHCDRYSAGVGFYRMKNFQASLNLIQIIDYQPFASYSKA